MRRIIVAAAILLLASVLALGAAGAALAQTSAHYDLEWHVIGGGAPVSSAHYAVNATIGQPLASPPVVSSASYQVSTGYWVLTIFGREVYLPLVVR